jgi:Caspase domain
MKSRTALFLFILACVAVALTSRTALAADPPSMRRIAVLVGANDPPPGRQPLRFGHADAQQLADVLTRVGRFLPADVHVLLDPTPAMLGAALTSAAEDVAAVHGEALFVFYYSGHSDGPLLYPHGESLSVADLRDRIEHMAARIRVGILDTCRGGSWTQAKGLTVGPPLDPTALFNVATEGTALVSSSSGLESAHEADAVNGSFFTHHFAAGLLGAADRTGDGNITLEEAFDYAKERTVRDSARLASTPQHPSFDLQLRGRQDIVLTSIATSSSALEVTQASAPIEIIHLPSGVTIAEAPPGQGSVRIAVPPGHYLVRSVVADRVLSREIDIRAGETAVIAGGQLVATGDARLALKGDELRRARPIDELSVPPARWGEVQLFAGVSDTAPAVGGAPVVGAGGTGLTRGFRYALAFNYGITDRLTIGAPLNLSYRFGRDGNFEAIPHLGSGVAYSTSGGLLGDLDAGVDFRIWTARSQSILLGLNGYYNTFVRTSTTQTGIDRSFEQEASVGYWWTIADIVTLHLAVDASVEEPLSHPPAQPPASTDLELRVGSLQTLASRHLPLIQVHVLRQLSLDFDTTWAFDLTTGAFRDEYLGGFTWAF